jgi:hypothetical protein
MADRKTPLRSEAVNLALDGEQFIDALDGLDRDWRTYVHSRPVRVLPCKPTEIFRWEIAAHRGIAAALINSPRTITVGPHSQAECCPGFPMGIHQCGESATLSRKEPFDRRLEGKP